MPKNKTSKNTLRIDASIRQKMPLSVREVLFIGFCLLLAWQADLLGWQYVFVAAVLMVIGLIAISRPKVLSISCTHSDELWEIGVRQGKRHELWQGYLSHIERVPSLQTTIMLTFYIIEPMQRTLTVAICRNEVNDEMFRRLSGLCSLRER